MKMSEVMTLAEAMVRLRDLKASYERTEDKDGNPLSESVLAFNASIQKRIQRIIDTLNSLVDGE